MIPITYLTGDATNPTDVLGPKIIAHICNDAGMWGAGFVLALSRRWKDPELMYRLWSTTYNQPSTKPFQLGETQFVQVAKEMWVANMIAQTGVINSNNLIPLNYLALDSCLQEVANYALKRKASIVGPRFGCGLAGGKWENVEKLIQKNLCLPDLAVFIYDLEKGKTP